MAEEKKKLNIFAIVLSLVILILILVIISLYSQLNKSVNAPKIEGEIINQDWLIDHCKCTEWNSSLTCKPGYVLKGKVCFQGNDFTNAIRPCSKYSCEYKPQVNLTIDNSVD